MTALVSILIPCYNAEPWLATTLESALGQTWPRCEIILVDDGSTDGSLALARTFAARGVQVVSQPNGGASSARNHALRLARGDYLQFLDADDLLAPDKIAQQMACLGAGETDVLLSGAWARFHDSPASAEFRPDALSADFRPIDFILTKFSAHCMMHPAAWLVPRRLADSAGPWDERLSLDDDGEYFTRVVLCAREVRYCAAARSYYRSGLRGSLSRRRSEKAWLSQFSVVEQSLDRLLAAESSPRTRRVTADTLQRLVFDAYPAVPELRRRAEQRIVALGGSALRYEAGPRFHWVARLVGWRLAKRLRNFSSHA